MLVPGEARTEMNAGSTASPYAAVGMTLTLLSHPPGGPNGGFFHRDGRHLAFAYSPPFAADLLESVERGIQIEAFLDDGDEDINRTAIQICDFTAFSVLP